MDQQKIKELKERREHLQEELRLKKLRDRIAPQIAHLEKLGQSFSVYDEFENLNWIHTNVQVRNKDGYNGIHGDFQIDVNDSLAKDIVLITEEEIDSDKFAKHFLSLIPQNSSLIVCYLGGDPELEISVEAFLSKPTVFFSNPETWIITTDLNWIIEYIWEQGLIRFIQVQESTPVLIKKITIEY